MGDAGGARSGGKVAQNALGVKGRRAQSEAKSPPVGLRNFRSHVNSNAVFPVVRLSIKEM